jgi:hypothetical protein
MLDAYRLTKVSFDVKYFVIKVYKVIKVVR